MARPARSAQAKARDATRKTGISDAAVLKATGKTWDEWFTLLDEANAATRKHAEIARMLPAEIGDWWRQMVTVAYERARALRQVHQRASGEFAAAASKTFDAPCEVLFAAWNDARTRAAWLRKGVKVDKVRPNKSLRLTVDDTPVDITFVQKPNGKTQVAVDHRQLHSAADVQQAKAGWKDAFERLQKKLATLG